MSAIEKRRKKNWRSCVFCRRSHLVCDDQRPCTRCINRDIAHLCTDDNVGNTAAPSTPAAPTENNEPTADAGLNGHTALPDRQAGASGVQLTRTPSFLPQQPTFVSEHVGSEFSSLNEFLNMLEDPLLVNRNDGQEKSQDEGSKPFQGQGVSPIMIDEDQQGDNIAPTPKEHFFLTAADPSTEMTPEDRLKLVINAKLEAGLLQPYNYAQGYSRLQNYMDRYMNQYSKQRILKPLSTIRPAFRAIARSLKDVDLVLVEEGFERMLLSYDRVFTSMSMPACLWRRTGEIYRANKEFASLVDCTVDDLRDGKLAIYELMTEESAVNFWEKYGSIAFDKGQKAVLTSCNLRTRDGRRRRPCCFSFTIRRDRYNIPICIVGNFIPIS